MRRGQVSKMSDFIATGDDLTAVANAIRAKGGTSGSLVFPNGFIQAIQNIITGIIPTGNKEITENGNNIDVYDYATVSVNVPSSGPNIDTKTVTNSSNQATSLAFTSMKGQPKAFFLRCTSSLTRSSSQSYYYVAAMRWDGSQSGGVAGNVHARSNGQLSNVTSGYSFEYSGTTLTVKSSGARNTSPGSFYNGTYELVYIY